MTDDVADRRPHFTIRNGSSHRLHLTGELDLDTAPMLADALQPYVARGGTVELDVTELTFMDSTGIHVLCDAARLIGERGRIAVIHPTPAVRRVIEITGVVGTIDLADDRASTSHRTDDPGADQ